jgi:hypothetical protein
MRLRNRHDGHAGRLCTAHNVPLARQWPGRLRGWNYLALYGSRGCGKAAALWRRVYHSALPRLSVGSMHVHAGYCCRVAHVLQ